MSPQQAREIIEAAAERIAEWKQRLRINTGRGVETWDNPTGQLVSVSAPGEEPVKEPPEFTIYLWANTTVVSIEEPVYVPATDSAPGFLLDPGRTVVEQTGWYQHSQIVALSRGQYYAEESYRNPDDLIENLGTSAYPSIAGYFHPRFPGGIMRPLAPMERSSLYPVQPTQHPTRGALYRPQSVWIDDEGYQFINRTTTIVNVELSIRGYLPEYLDDRAKRDLDPEFEKGQSVGPYDLRIRQYDAVKGPDFYAPPRTEDGIDYEGYVTWATNPLLTSSRQRVGFAPVSLTFTSRANGPFIYSPGWESRGQIDVMGYRKV